MEEREKGEEPLSPGNKPESRKQEVDCYVVAVAGKQGEPSLDNLLKKIISSDGPLEAPMMLCTLRFFCHVWTLLPGEAKAEVGQLFDWWATITFII